MLVNYILKCSKICLPASTIQKYSNSKRWGFWRPFLSTLKRSVCHKNLHKNTSRRDKLPNFSENQFNQKSYAISKKLVFTKILFVNHCCCETLGEVSIRYTKGLIKINKTKYLLNTSDKHPSLSCDVCSGMFAQKMEASHKILVYIAYFKLKKAPIYSLKPIYRWSCTRLS